MDPRLVTYRDVTSLLSKLAATTTTLVFSRDNLIDRIWDRPAPPAFPISTRSLVFSGKSAFDKVADLRTYLRSSHGDHTDSCYLISSLPSIAWILNLRGGDIEFNPVFSAYLLVSAASLTLFVDQRKVDTEVRSAIESDLSGAIMDYEDVWTVAKECRGRIVTDPNVSWAFVAEVGLVSACLSFRLWDYWLMRLL